MLNRMPTPDPFRKRKEKNKLKGVGTENEALNKKEFLIHTINRANTCNIFLPHMFNRYIEKYMLPIACAIHERTQISPNTVAKLQHAGGQLFLSSSIFIILHGL